MDAGRSRQGFEVVPALEARNEHAAAVLGGRFHELFGDPGEIGLDQPELGQRIAEMCVETGGNDQEVRREFVERGQDPLLVGRAELIAVVAGLERALKILPTPVSSRAPVPGKSGI